MKRFVFLVRLLATERRGSATVEFALMSLFFFGIVIVALDFGIYQQQRLKLGSAVEQGAIIAFNNRDAVNAATIATYVRNAVGLTTDPQITCNNGAACVAAVDRGATDYRCINQLTGAIDTTAYAAGVICTGGGTSGYYLRIVATKTYNAVVVPNRWLGGSAMTQTAIVRLQ